jgi:replicative DNA helicase
MADLDPVQQLKVPPHSLEAEQSVLGGLLLDNEAWERVGDAVQAADFYRAEKDTDAWTSKNEFH